MTPGQLPPDESSSLDMGQRGRPPGRVGRELRKEAYFVRLAASAWNTAKDKEQERRRSLEQAVLDAARAGMSLRAIQEATGGVVSLGTIHQIVERGQR